MARLGPDRKGDRKVRDDGIGLLLDRSHHIVHGPLTLANLGDVHRETRTRPCRRAINNHRSSRCYAMR